MEKLIKGIIEFREKTKDESIESGIHYTMGWFGVEVKEVIKKLNQLEEGNKMFKCIKELVLSVYDDDNEVIENEHIKVDKGSEWLIKECDYCENDIRLVNDNAEWIEISIRTFKEHFVDKVKEEMKKMINIDELKQLEEDTLKFYYCESKDEYWIGKFYRVA